MSFFSFFRIINKYQLTGIPRRTFVLILNLSKVALIISRQNLFTILIFFFLNQQIATATTKNTKKVELNLKQNQSLHRDTLARNTNRPFFYYYYLNIQFI